MALILRPGMRLMRRLGIAGKFGLLAVLLAVPLVVNVTASIRQTDVQIGFTSQERAGLVLARPLVHLLVEVAVVRDAALRETLPDPAAGTVVVDVDAADATVGEDLGVHTVWRQIRPTLPGLWDPTLSHPARAASALGAMKQVEDLLVRVGDVSNLDLDTELGSHYLTTALMDDVPRLVRAVSDSQANQGDPANSAGADADRRAATNAVDAAARQLNLDVTTAVTSADGASTRSRVTPALWAMTNTITAFTRAVSATVAVGTQASTTPGAATTKIASADAQAVLASTTALSGVLTEAADAVMAERQDQLWQAQRGPLAMTLLALVVVGYLFVSLFRATTRDVRSVLEGISTVTVGDFHQSPALQGSDEFGQMSRAVVYASDQLTAKVSELKYRATHDDLTSLANRALFVEKTDEALAATSVQVVVAVINLDGFKDINDTFGHDIGDRVLRTVAARLHRCSPRRSVVARLGGDEFAVLITESREGSGPHQYGNRIEQALAEPVDIDGRKVRLRAGIGIAHCTPGEMPSIELIRDADVALNVAKDRGRGHTVYFEPSMQDRTRERTHLSADLVQAVDRGEMRVVYQPLVDLETGTMHGLEALVRWRHPVRGDVSPSVFVPLAEATGVIAPIGRWVLEQACRQLATWQRTYPDSYPLTMDVNLSTDQLAEPSVVADVLAVIGMTGIDPTTLVLEITESSLVRDLDNATRRLRQLATAGLRLALDDFGTGYSSLSYLRQLPVNVLKIDKAFVDDTDPDGQALLRSIVDLGLGQGLQIVAEGIETLDQARLLRDAGCHLGQGFLWSRPLEADEITALLRQGGQMQPIPRSDPGLPADLPLQRGTPAVIEPRD